MEIASRPHERCIGFDHGKAKSAVKPYHGDLTPLGVLERKDARS